jgi:glycosyltransferase involved in cell wall biosynthesis
MRINWFSPLPPERTGIADYSAGVLAALARRAQVTLWTEQTVWDKSLEDLAEVKHYDVQHLRWEEINRADISFYHIGNNACYHQAIWEVSRRQPGIVVLHDLRLQHFFVGLYRERWKDRAGYVEQMQQWYGSAGRQAAEVFWNGGHTIEFMAEHYPLTPLALAGARGVVVHTWDAWTELKAAGPWPLAYAPLPYRAAERGDPPLVRRCNGDETPCRLVVFGHIGPNRRLDTIFQALADLPERQRFRLDVYGQVWNKEQLAARARDLGLEGAVSLHGFVLEPELDAALDRADLAFNLRYPTMGEASISQLRIWDRGLPSLVTSVGWYATLPNSAVAFVRPEHEVADIQGHLRTFLAEPSSFRKMGAAGRRILEDKHAPEAYAETLVSFAASVQEQRLCAVASEMADRVGGAWDDCFPGLWNDETLRNVAAKILNLFTTKYEHSRSEPNPRVDFHDLPLLRKST